MADPARGPPVATGSSQHSSATATATATVKETPSPTPMMSSLELDFLIYSYLQESGYSSTGSTLLSESNINATPDPARPRVPPGHLVKLLQKGLLYCQAEAAYRGANTTIKLIGSPIDNELPLPPLPKKRRAPTPPPSVPQPPPVPSSSAAADSSAQANPKQTSRGAWKDIEQTKEKGSPHEAATNEKKRKSSTTADESNTAMEGSAMAESDHEPEGKRSRITSDEGGSAIASKKSNSKGGKGKEKEKDTNGRSVLPPATSTVTPTGSISHEAKGKGKAKAVEDDHRESRQKNEEDTGMKDDYPSTSTSTATLPLPPPIPPSTSMPASSDSTAAIVAPVAKPPLPMPPPPAPAAVPVARTGKASSSTLSRELPPPPPPVPSTSSAIPPAPSSTASKRPLSASISSNSDLLQPAAKRSSSPSIPRKTHSSSGSNPNAPATNSPAPPLPPPPPPVSAPSTAATLQHPTPAVVTGGPPSQQQQQQQPMKIRITTTTRNVATTTTSGNGRGGGGENSANGSSNPVSPVTSRGGAGEETSNGKKLMKVKNEEGAEGHGFGAKGYKMGTKTGSPAASHQGQGQENGDRDKKKKSAAVVKEKEKEREREREQEREREREREKEREKRDRNAKVDMSRCKRIRGMGDATSSGGSGGVIRLKGHTVAMVQPCSFNSKVPTLLATGAGDSTCRIWDVPSPTTSSGSIDPERAIQVEEHIICKHASAQRKVGVAAVAWNPSGSLLATGSEDGIARIWTPSGDLHLVLSMHQRAINSLRWAPSGTLLLTGSLDSTVCLWELSSGKVRQQYSTHGDSILDVDWNDDTTFASASMDKTVHLFATGRSNPIHRLRGHRDEVNVVKFSPCGTLVATCSDDHTVRIWSLRNLPALASTIDKKSVKKGDESRKIDIEDEAGCLVLEGHESEVHQISWKPGCGKEGTEKDGNRLIASCSFDHTAKLWDADQGTCLYTFSRHQDFVYSIAFEPALGRFLATGSNDGTVMVWRVKDKALVLEYESPAPVYELTFNPPGTQIAVTGQLEQVAVVPFDPVASFNA